MSQNNKDNKNTLAQKNDTSAPLKYNEIIKVCGGAANMNQQENERKEKRKPHVYFS